MKVDKCWIVKNKIPLFLYTVNFHSRNAREWMDRQMHLRVARWLVEIWRPVKQRSAGYMSHSESEQWKPGNLEIISTIISRYFFVTLNKQPMTIGTNRMWICRDYNCANTMCFPRQLSTTARKQLTTIIDDYHCFIRRVWYIRVVLSVSLLVSYFVMNFIIVDGFSIETNWYECQL